MSKSRNLLPLAIQPTVLFSDANQAARGLVAMRAEALRVSAPTLKTRKFFSRPSALVKDPAPRISPGRLGRFLPWLASAFMIVAVSVDGSGAQIVLNVQPGASPNEVVLTWSGGTPTYNLYAGGSGDLSGGGVEILLSGTSSTSYTASFSGDLVYFRVGDSTAPQPTITNPLGNVVGDHVTVSGNTTSSAAAVWVNRKPSNVVGTSFAASDVLLALGDNTLHAGAVSSDGNISIASSQVTRIPGNDPPLISIVSPSDGAEVTDVTPLIQLSYSDSPALDPANLHVYLDGTDQTSNFTPTATATSASWQVPGANPLVLGDHVLRATIKDGSGYTSSTSAEFRVSGPRLDSLTPSKGIPTNTITVSGAGFGTASETAILFNGIQATTILSLTDSQIRVRVPPGATDGPLIVEVNGIPSNPLSFDIAFGTAGGSSRYIAIDSQDRISYIDSTRHEILRINQDGTGLTSMFSSPIDTIEGLSYDPSGTTLYVTTRGEPHYEGQQFSQMAGRIYSVDSPGVAVLRFYLDPFVEPRFTDPVGIDAKPPYIYVGADMPDTAEVVLQLNLNSPSSRGIVSSFPFSQQLLWDVKIDSNWNVYALFLPAGQLTNAIHKNGSLIYQTGNPYAMSIDCLNRVTFSDSANEAVYRLTASNDAIWLASFGTGGPHGIDIDSRGNIFVGHDSGIVRASGATGSVASCRADFPVSISGDAGTGGSGKVYADYDPSAAAETPDSQFIVLTACLGDSSIPRASGDRVYWTWEDVDDPSPDPTIDPNGAQVCGPGVRCDNLGDLDGSLEFTQEGVCSGGTKNGQSCTSTPECPGGTCVIFNLTDSGVPSPFRFGTAYATVGSSICSKVRFHLTDAPGDNFTVTATLRTKVGDRAVVSKVMTVWKRLHMELDSMGEVEGVIDTDDAVIGDVPDPIGDFLAAAFAPAFIEVINDGPWTRTNVAFDPHVPNQFANRTDIQRRIEINTQGSLGRDGESSTGSWRVYIQGAYEGGLDGDHDPDSDLPYLGISNAYRGKYALLFTETIRDYADSSPVLDEAYYLRAMVLHEIAHEFDVAEEEVSSDGSGGIMELKSNYTFPYFNASQLRIIRSIGQAGHFPGELEGI